MKEHNKQPIYLLGFLLHNKAQNQYLIDQGVHLITANTVQQKIMALRKIKNNNAVIVLPTHGIEPDVKTFIKKKFTTHYDLTCRHLTKNIKIIHEILQSKYRVLFYAKKQHPETQSVLNVDKSIKLINSEHNVQVSRQINKNHRYVLINQSTLPNEFCQDAYTILKCKLNHIRQINTTCAACKLRFNKIRTFKNVDLLVIVGDKLSQNATSLANLAKLYDVRFIQVTSPNQGFSKHDFNNVNTCAIISSTSTAPETVDAVYNNIVKLNHAQKT